MSSVCVHGLGYIGLPTAAMLANHGHTVYGYDISDEVVSKLEDGGIHIDEPGLRAFVTQAVNSGNLRLSREIVQAEYHVICVPTPFDDTQRTADLEYIEDAAKALSPDLRAGDTVILESTVPPETTQTVLKPLLETSGLTAGTDFGLVHCPETVLPGNIITELQHNDRIIGGIDEESTQSALKLYESFVEGETYLTDTRTAEFVKLIQNTFRDANIAIANEIAKIAHEYGVDSREAISLANNHPRVDILNPGPGVGGHCLPIDPWFLTQAYDRDSIIEHARDVNDGMVEYVVERLEAHLGSLDGVTVAVFGIAYKGNVADTRQSPGLRLARTLQQEGANIAIHDPHVTDQTLDIVTAESAVTGADALVVMTDHDAFEKLSPEEITGRMNRAVVFDTRGILPTDHWGDVAQLFTL
jgi:UDP-N-acetyl-D-mannosaminuronic acid dehydrogenase